jgi:hypothetical protein
MNKTHITRVEKSCRSKVSKKNVWSIPIKNLSVLIEMSSINEDKSGKVDVELKVVMDGVMETDQAQQDAVNGEYSSDLTCPFSPLCCHNVYYCHIYVVIPVSCTGIICYNPSPNHMTNAVAMKVYDFSLLVSSNKSSLKSLYVDEVNIGTLVIEPYLVHYNKMPSSSVNVVWNIPSKYKRVGTYRSVTPTYVVQYFCYTFSRIVAEVSIGAPVIEPYLVLCNKTPSSIIILVCNIPPQFKRIGTYRSVTPTYVGKYPCYTYSRVVIDRMRTPSYPACVTLSVIVCNCYSRYRE